MTSSVPPQVQMLTEQQNQKLCSTLGPRSKILGSALIDVYTLGNDFHWSRQHKSVLALLTKDNLRRAYYIQVYNIEEIRLLLEIELPLGVEYCINIPFFHIINNKNKNESSGQSVGLRFHNDNQATAFGTSVRQCRRKRDNKKKQTGSPNETRNHEDSSVPANEFLYRNSGNYVTNKQIQASQTSAEVSVNGSSPTEPNRKQVTSVQLQNDQTRSPPSFPTNLNNSTEIEDDSLSPTSRKPVNRKKKIKIKKEQIGSPTDFKHITHIGFDPYKEDPQLSIEQRLQGFFHIVGASEPEVLESTSRSSFYSEDYEEYTRRETLVADTSTSSPGPILSMPGIKSINSSSEKKVSHDITSTSSSESSHQLNCTSPPSVCPSSVSKLPADNHSVSSSPKQASNLSATVLNSNTNPLNTSPENESLIPSLSVETNLLSTSTSNSYIEDVSTSSDQASTLLLHTTSTSLLSTIKSKLSNNSVYAAESDLILTTSNLSDKSEISPSKQASNVDSTTTILGLVSAPVQDEPSDINQTTSGSSSATVKTLELPTTQAIPNSTVLTSGDLLTLTKPSASLDLVSPVISEELQSPQINSALQTTALPEVTNSSDILTPLPKDSNAPKVVAVKRKVYKTRSNPPSVAPPPPPKPPRQVEDTQEDNQE